MSVLIGLLTTVLVLNCFFLVLLILIQLPKKESGSGLAFGGGTLDMALGAGAGNMRTKLTKVSAALCLLLCLVLAIIGEQFDVGNEICGAVVSIRHSEDIIAVWNRNADNEGALHRIRDTPVAVPRNT